MYELTGIKGESWQEEGVQKTKTDRVNRMKLEKKIKRTQAALEASLKLVPDMPDKSSKLTKKERERQIKRNKARVASIQKRAKDDLLYEQKELERLLSVQNEQHRNAMKAIQKKLEIDSEGEKKAILQVAWGDKAGLVKFRLIETKQDCHTAVLKTFPDEHILATNYGTSWR